MSDFDEHLTGTARLRLVAMLSGVDRAEFGTVRDELEVSDSVLSKHLGALEDAGYLSRSKGSLDGRRTTWVSLTRAGRRALAAHVAALREVIDGVGTASD